MHHPYYMSHPAELTLLRRKSSVSSHETSNLLITQKEHKAENRPLCALVFCFGLKSFAEAEDIIHILIASAGKIDENRALAHFLCELNAICDSMARLDSGDDTLES